MEFPPLLAVMRKLNRLKWELKSWSKNVYGQLNDRIREAEEEYSCALAAADDNWEEEDAILNLNNKEIRLNELLICKGNELR